MSVFLLVLLYSEQARADDPLPLFRIQGHSLIEASGIAVHPGNELFYFNQDAGSDPAIFVLDSTGSTRATIRLPVPNVDWEDIAFRQRRDSPNRIYIADTGDAYFANKAAKLPPRKNYSIIVFDVPDVALTGPTADLDAAGVAAHPFVFADGATHNAESLLVRPATGEVFVVSKSEQPTTPALMWAAPPTMSETSTNTFTEVGPVPVVAASGGAFSPTGDRFVVRNATAAYLWHVEGEETMADSLAREPIQIPLPAQRQGEGVSFTPDGASLLLSSEGTGAPVWKVTLPNEGLSRPAPAKDSEVSTTGGDQATDGQGRRARQVVLISGLGLVAVLTLGLRRRWMRRESQ